MSLEDNKENNEMKEENIKEKEIINNENNENNKAEEKEEDDDKIEGTKAYFVISNITDNNEENKDNELLDNKEKQRNEKNRNIDTSTLVLKNNDDTFGNNNISQLNAEKSEIKKIENNNLNQSFMQRTKSWMSNMWTNVKNYDYGKYNIFKKTEMEDCLDAHGNHIKIPKKKEEKTLKVKENKDEDFMKYNNLDYNRYYSNYNANVFAGYPF